MTITALPTAPQRSDPPSTFVARADALVAALSTFVTQVNTDIGVINALASGLPARAAYTFEATTTGPPTSACLRFNNATQTSATSIFISQTMAASVDATAFLTMIGASTSATKAILRVVEQGTPGDYIYFRVTAAVDNGTDWTLTVVCIGASATGSNVPIGATTVYVDVWPMADAANAAAGLAMGNTNITGLRLAMFNSEVNNATASGTVNIDWTTGARQKQVEPTNNITYTMTAPASPCHVQLKVISDGTSPAVTFAWPATVKWLGAAYLNHPANKGAIIAGWYDGTDYWLQGASQV